MQLIILLSLATYQALLEDKAWTVHVQWVMYYHQLVRNWFVFTSYLCIVISSLCYLSKLWLVIAQVAQIHFSLLTNVIDS